MGFLDHPHTSAGRVPTDRGYRYYVDTLLAREPPRSGAGLAARLELGDVRREVDSALRRLADVAAQVTSLLALVTAPPPESATVRHVEVLVLQPQLVMVVVITSTGAVTKRMFAFDRAVDGGLAEWAAAFLNDRVTGLGVGARMIEARLADPSLGPREQEFLAVIATAVMDLDADEPSALYVGGQARFLAERRTQDLREIDALMQALEERYALLAMLRGALARNELYLRIGHELPDIGLRGLSLVAANYGVARRTWGRSRSSGRCGWTTAWPSPRSGRPPRCSPSTWRRCTDRGLAGRSWRSHPAVLARYAPCRTVRLSRHFPSSP